MLCYGASRYYGRKGQGWKDLGWKTDVKLCDERKGHFCYLLSFVGYLHSVEDFFCLRVKFLLPKKH